jgi:nicotinamide-nucleotide amidase
MTRSVAEAVIERLRDRRETLAVAESCTGGLIGHLLTEVPGVSQVFLGGVVAYSNAVKRSLLEVTDEALREFGAVSAETVRLMALGVRTALQSDWGLAVSGVLGPGGGTPEKPVGTAWIAVSGPDGSVQAERFHWHEDRSGNKRRTAEQALALLLARLRQP